MKKSLILCAAAALALVACTKSEFVDSAAKGGESVSFRVAMNNLTKTSTDAYWGNDATNLAIFGASSFYKKDGSVIKPSVFTDASGNPVYSYLVKDGTYWYLKDGNDATTAKDLIFPLGTDLRTDVLALGVHTDYLAQVGTFSYLENLTDVHTAYNAGWSTAAEANWTPVFADKDNYAKKVQFVNVDTRKHQYDVVYGSANNLEKGNTYPLVLNHAQALIIFNMKIKAKVEGLTAASLLFVNPPQGTEAAMMSTPDYLSNYLNSLTGASYLADFLPLKTVGTFVVDNSKNNLEAYWDLDKYAELTAYESAMKDVNRMYLANLSAVPSYNAAADGGIAASDKFPVTATDYADKFYQMGHQFIPEQPTVNPYLYYTVNGQTFITEINLPRGTWMMGHYYTYNITLDFNGLNFDVTVEPWVDGGTYNAYL